MTACAIPGTNDHAERSRLVNRRERHLHGPKLVYRRFDKIVSEEVWDMKSLGRLRKQALVCVLIALATGSVSAARTAQHSGLKQVLSLPVGEGGDQIAVRVLPGGETLGPDSFAVLPDGSFLILDSAKKVILRCMDEKVVSTIDVSFMNEPKDLVVAPSGLIYVLDQPHKIYELSPEGQIRKILKLPPDIPTSTIWRLGIASAHDITLKMFGQEEYSLTDLSLGKTIPLRGHRFRNWEQPVTVTAERGCSSISLGPSDSIMIEGNGFIRGVSVQGIDTKLNVYVQHIDLNPDSSRIEGSWYISRYDKSGNLKGRIALPPYKVFAPTRDIDVSDAGEVHWMTVSDTRVFVYRVNLDCGVAPLKPLFFRPSNSPAYCLVAPQSSTPYTRTQLIDRANEMIGYSWTYNSANGSNPSPGTVTKPDWLVSISYGTAVQGIPYCWGGFDGTDTASTGSWTGFGDAMGKGCFAGNVNTSTPSYQSGTAGLDCAGFVSAVAGFGAHHAADVIYANDSYPVSFWESLSMDVYVNPNKHILFMYGVSLDGTVVYSKESTKSGDDKVKDYTRDLKWLQANGYDLRRVNGL